MTKVPIPLPAAEDDGELKCWIFSTMFSVGFAARIPRTPGRPAANRCRVCQRCTGVYVGALVAALLHLAMRPRPRAAGAGSTARFSCSWFPSGFYWIPQNPELRAAAGILFGFGLVAFLRLTLPAEFSIYDLRFTSDRNSRAERKSQIANRKCAALLATLVLVPLLAEDGTPPPPGLLTPLRRRRAGAGGAAAGQFVVCCCAGWSGGFPRASGMNELFFFVRPPRPLWPFNGPATSFWPPLAFASLAAMLRRHNPGLARGNPRRAALEMGWRSLEREIRSRRPAVVAMGEEAVSCAECLRLARLASSLGAKVIAGGCFFGHVAPAGFADRPGGCGRARRRRKHYCGTRRRAPRKFRRTALAQRRGHFLSPRWRNRPHAASPAYQKSGRFADARVGFAADAPLRRGQPQSSRPGRHRIVARLFRRLRFLRAVAADGQFRLRTNAAFRPLQIRCRGCWRKSKSRRAILAAGISAGWTRVSTRIRNCPPNSRRRCCAKTWPSA